jgi:Spy/CpxP family protein refolding chaperone
MKKANLVIIGLAAVLILGSAACVYAEGEPQKRGKGHKESIFKELNLTPEQQKKLAENRRAQGEEMASLRASIKEKQDKLQGELKNPAVTREKVEPLVNEIKSLQARLIDHRVNGIFAVKKILTPEQLVKFEQMMEKGHKDKKGHARDGRNNKKSGEND